MPDWLWKERSTCRLCGQARLRELAQFPPMAIATTNFHYERLAVESSSYLAPMPLPLDVCDECGLFQVRIVGNPEVQYRDYAYRTTLSVGLPQHFVDSAGTLIARLGLKPEQTVVEFGSNDGTYLRAFRARGLRVVGVDPAVEIAEAATRSGIPTYADFFNSALAGRIVSDHGKADLLVANNVIANIDELQEVFETAHRLLNKQGAFVFETQYGRDVFDNFLLDTIYHEHLTYFNVSPLEKTLHQFGLEIFDVERIATKGGSIRVFAQPIGADRTIAGSVSDLVAAEAHDRVGSAAYFAKFTAGVEQRRDQIKQLIGDFAGRSGIVCGYGVSIGTAALLGQLGLATKIAFLVDDDPDKPTRFLGPNYAIPVKRPEALVTENPPLTVIFAWRYANTIVAKNSAYRERGGKFLIPLPAPRLV